jgi:hypothetical protein
MKFKEFDNIKVQCLNAIDDDELAYKIENFGKKFHIVDLKYVGIFCNDTGQYLFSALIFYKGY